MAEFHIDECVSEGVKGYLVAWGHPTVNARDLGLAGASDAHHSFADRRREMTESLFTDLPVLETERLLLRKMSLADAEEMFAYASDPEVVRYTSWERHASIEDTRVFLAGAEQRYRDNRPVAWAMVHKAEGRFIGTCGFGSWQPEHGRAEIGYALARHYWGQGHTTEAARAVIEYGFGRMGLNRIQATCMVANVASARVMEKVGMRFEGILRQYVFRRGVYEDLKMYAILAEDWRQVHL